MIHESRYWKTPLLRAATWLERVRVDEDSAERVLVRIERELFIGFYAIRKLLDTFKVSRESRSMKFQLNWFPCIKPVDYMNAHRIDELFDLDEMRSETRDLAFVCNQFIHSYIFTSLHDEDGALSGAYVSSDRVRDEKLYLVPLNEILRAFRTVGKDYPRSQSLQRNPKTHQWEEVDIEP